MNKKLLSGTAFALLLVLAFSVLVSPALATESNKRSVKIQSLCNLPEIRVTVPSTGEIFLNPFNIPVEIDGETIDEQIVSSPAAIQNNSDVPLSVSVTVEGAVGRGSDLRLTLSTTKGATWTAKGAFIYFEMQSAASRNASNISWAAEYDENQHIVVLDGRERSKNNMVILDQADKENCFGVFRLTGDCIATPRDPWDKKIDTVKVSIVFTFTPLMRSYS